MSAAPVASMRQPPTGRISIVVHCPLIVSGVSLAAKVFQARPPACTLSSTD